MEINWQNILENGILMVVVGGILIGAWNVLTALIKNYIKTHYTDDMEDLKKAKNEFKETIGKSKVEFREMNDKFSKNISDLSGVFGRLQKDVEDNINRLIVAIDNVGIKVEESNERFHNQMVDLRLELKADIKEVHTKIDQQTKEINCKFEVQSKERFEHIVVHNELHPEKKVPIK
jgi:uncharacterized membrane-anchored protein YhcB (DUF1043 family)